MAQAEKKMDTGRAEALMPMLAPSSAETGADSNNKAAAHIYTAAQDISTNNSDAALGDC